MLPSPLPSPATPGRPDHPGSGPLSSHRARPSPARPQPPARCGAPVLAALVALATLGAMAGGLVACTDTGWPDRDPVVLDNPGADSLVFHPPVHYALPGDPLTVRVHGLKTGYACAEVLAFKDTVSDSADHRVVSVTARIRWPGVPECPLVTGKDTTFDLTAPSAGRTLVLRTPGGVRSDSLRVFSGSGSVREFGHPPGDTLTVHDRFTFRDSTAAHPRRVLYTHALAPCEVLQSAVWSRRPSGDTLRISYRILTASPALPDTVLPACADTHGDTIRVVAEQKAFT